MEATNTITSTAAEQQRMELQFDTDDQEDFVDVHMTADEEGLGNDINPLDDFSHVPQQQLEQTLLEDEQKQITNCHEAVENDDDNEFEMKPLLLHDNDADTNHVMNGGTASSSREANSIHIKPHIRSRKRMGSGSTNTNEDDIDDAYNTKRSCSRSDNNHTINEENRPCDRNTNKNDDEHEGESPPNSVSGGPAAAMGCGRIRRFCRDSSQHYLVRTTVSVMSFMARVLLWGSFLAMVVGVVWYSRELKMNGTDPHLIAWFSAGAFVLLGFPISMCGIFMHLTNYYQPNVQCYVVRILWMVPIYSIESWLW